MSWLARLFGDVGIVRFRAVMPNGDSYQGKIEIESFNNSKTEVEAYIKNALFVEHGIRAKSVEMLGFIEK